MASIYPPTVSTHFPSGFCRIHPQESQRSPSPEKPSFSTTMASPSEVPQNPIDAAASTIATRAPLQESSTKDAQCFGAAQINSSLHCWKRWYLIENDASIGYVPEWEHPSAYQVRQSAHRAFLRHPDLLGPRRRSKARASGRQDLDPRFPCNDGRQTTFCDVRILFRP